MAETRVVNDLSILCDEDGAYLDYMILQRKVSLAMLFLEDIIALLVCLKYYYFLSILNFCFESYGSEHSCHNKENYTDKYVG